MTFQQKSDRKQARSKGLQAIRSMQMSFAAYRNETGHSETFANDAAWWAKMAARSAYYAHPEWRHEGCRCPANHCGLHPGASTCGMRS